MTDLAATIDAAWEDRANISLATTGAVRDAVAEALNLLDSGEARVAEPVAGGWQVNQWLKKAVLLSFRLHDMEMIEKLCHPVVCMAEGKVLPEHPANALIEKMVKTLDRPGKKASKGFYDYPQGGEKHLWKGLTEQFPLAKTQLGQPEMIDRLMYVQANEAAKCHEENVVMTVADTNIGSIFGWGFAPHQGGALQFINAVGVAKFVARSEELAAKYGERFKPAALLKKMATEGKRFEQ